MLCKKETLFVLWPIQDMNLVGVGEILTILELKQMVHIFNIILYN
jgi:hypothetical protein